MRCALRCSRRLPALNVPEFVKPLLKLTTPVCASTVPVLLKVIATPAAGGTSVTPLLATFRYRRIIKYLPQPVAFDQSYVRICSATKMLWRPPMVGVNAQLSASVYIKITA